MPRPNLLLLFSDQHRPQAMGCAGDPNCATPNLDRLAREGVRCTRAYAPTPLCSPFRASLYTGQYITTHGVISLHRPLLPRQPELAEVLRDAGWHTSHMGKWHLAGGAGPCHFVSGYFRPGWDDWRGWENSNEPLATAYAIGDAPQPLRRMEGYQTDELTDWTLEWLAAQPADRPWFHVMSVEPPHPPNVAPEADLARFRDRALVLRPNLPADDPRAGRWLEGLRGYYAQVENLDRNLGRVLAALAERGELDRTVVVYLSDHGEQMGCHGRTGKSRPEEESTRIPLLVRYPPALPAGATCEALVSAVDLMPSLLGLLGVPPPTGMDGADLSSCLRDPALPGPDDLLLQYENTFFPATPPSVYRGLVTSRHKLVRFLLGDMLCFDLADDPYELENLAADPARTGLCADLEGRLRERLAGIGDDFYARYDAG